MIPIKKVALVLGMAVLLVGCDDFGDLNEDSNNPSELSTDLLLTNAETYVSDVIGSPVGVLWTQQLAETQYDDDSRYQITSYNFNTWYYEPLKNLQTIIDVNTDEETREQTAVANGSNANQIAVARILKAYFYHFMTDRWGPIPYSEALQGRDNFSPAYDSQQFIYGDLINELNEAVEQMDDGDGVAGDILFGGDMDQWALFANSLRARIALRMADVPAGELPQGVDPAAEFADAVNDGLITDDVMYPYLGDADNENPWYTRFRTRTDYAISDVIANYMLNLEDPRILVYANPAPNQDNEDGVVTFDEIVGMNYDAPNPGDIENAVISFPGSAIGAGGPGVGQQDAPLPIITVAELNFAQAEAIERGWAGVAGSAQQFYEDAIEASWEQWGVYDDADFAAYIAQAEVDYTTADWEERIGEQKWLALFPNGYEAWAEWRRLGYPELDPHARALTSDDEIPVRHAYPSTEERVNTENYNAAVEEFLGGEDAHNVNLWWDRD